MKPHLNIGIIGGGACHTNLTAAIVAALSQHKLPPDTPVVVAYPSDDAATIKSKMREVMANHDAHGQATIYFAHPDQVPEPTPTRSGMSAPTVKMGFESVPKDESAPRLDDPVWAYTQLEGKFAPVFGHGMTMRKLAEQAAADQAAAMAQCEPAEFEPRRTGRDRSHPNQPWYDRYRNNKRRKK